MSERISIEHLIGLDGLHHASGYLKEQFRLGMTRDEAKANLDARAILFNCSNKILESCARGITRAEVEGAIIIDREMDGWHD